MFKKDIKKETKEDFYHLMDNLYLIKIPEDGGKDRVIENLFEKKLLNEKYEGRSFSLSNDWDKDKEYGKSIFAKEIILKKASLINFNGFSSLLDRIEAAIADYTKKLAGN